MLTRAKYNKRKLLYYEAPKRIQDLAWPTYMLRRWQHKAPAMKSRNASEQLVVTMHKWSDKHHTLQSLSRPYTALQGLMQPYKIFY